jgi:hypothetical protein
MLAGANEPVLQALRDWTTLQGGQARSRCVGQSERLPASTAALINATAAHALDFDDFAFSNHPSAVLCPAILAAADASPTPVTGAQALRAYVLGYEIWADAFVREPDLYYDKGWHPTAILGPLGAAVAASAVMGLSEDQICHALALAASFAGGVFENFGTMAKPTCTVFCSTWVTRNAAHNFGVGKKSHSMAFGVCFKLRQLIAHRQFFILRCGIITRFTSHTGVQHGVQTQSHSSYSKRRNAAARSRNDWIQRHS